MDLALRWRARVQDLRLDRSVIRALLVLTSALLALPALAADPIRPDQVLTPGRVLTRDTAKVCVPGYSATVRNTSAALKRQVFLAYGIEPRGSSAYEIDHRLPLSLGGADVAANLWPETRDRSRARERLGQGQAREPGAPPGLHQAHDDARSRAAPVPRRLDRRSPETDRTPVKCHPGGRFYEVRATSTRASFVRAPRPSWPR
jgi:hypothetical protein